MRIVFGMREVHKYCRLGKLKCIIMAPNIEQMEAEGSLDDRIRTILSAASVGGTVQSDAGACKIDVVFALSRARFGKAVEGANAALNAAAAQPGEPRKGGGKCVRISIAGVLDYSGADREYKQMLALAEEGRAEYARLGEARRDREEREREGPQTAVAAAGHAVGAEAPAPGDPRHPCGSPRLALRAEAPVFVPPSRRMGIGL